jgi:hypothetical protein
MKNIISYGGGTQSSALVIMSLEGEYNLPRPDFGVYADVGAEPEFVNDYVAYFIDYVKRVYDFDIYVVQYKKGIIEQLKTIPKISRNGNFYTSSVPPFYVKKQDNTVGMLMRQCTGDFKINPCNKLINSKIKRGEKYNLWKGISFDERQRAKISMDKKKTFIYPLVENFTRRGDSITYLKNKGIKPAQRSSCIFCPFHSDAYWRWLKYYHPTEFQRAVDIEEYINTLSNKSNLKYYLHKSCVPIDKVIFKNENQLNMFPELIDECDAECGI